MEKELIDLNHFDKIDIQFGTVVEISEVEKSDKLLKLSVDFNGEIRQIVSGIRQSCSDWQSLKGKNVGFLLNLPVVKIRGVESYGMIVAFKLNGTDHLVTPLCPLEK